MSRNSQCLQLERPLGQLNRILTDKIDSARSVLTTRNFDKTQHNARENQLDSMFLIRKQKLLSICKQNKLIFEKIYTQKTSYSRQHFEQAYRTNKRIAERMLKSKERRREMFFRAGEICPQRKECRTRSSQRTIERLPSLDDRPISFFNQMYDLPRQENICRTVSVSSKHSTRPKSKGSLCKVQDFMMF